MKATVWGFLACALWLGDVPTASASDDEVVSRLGRYGDMNARKAGRLVKKISKQMKRSAGMANKPNDTVRVAVSRAMFRTDAPPDKMSEAKMRLRLYAGLNAWALEQLFPPRPGVVASCQSDFGAKRNECEALIAAAGRVALADAKQLGAGQAIAGAAPAPRRAPQRPTAAPRFAPRGASAPPTSRFARYDSGFRGGAAPAAAYAAPAPKPAPRYAAPRRTPPPAPMAAPAPVMRQPTQSASARKAAYQAKRQAYLDRKKAEMAARKAKMVAAAGGGMRDKSAAPAKAAAPKPAPKPVAAVDNPTAAPAEAPLVDEAAASAAPAKEAPKQALDDDFLNGLLADPLGG